MGEVTLTNMAAVETAEQSRNLRRAEAARGLREGVCREKGQQVQRDSAGLSRESRPVSPGLLEGGREMPQRARQRPSHSKPRRPEWGAGFPRSPGGQG